MSIIEQLDPISFTNYLKKYRNTICGRHPIGVLLNVRATKHLINLIAFSKTVYACKTSLWHLRFNAVWEKWSYGVKQ